MCVKAHGMCKIFAIMVIIQDLFSYLLQLSILKYQVFRKNPYLLSGDFHHLAEQLF